MDSVAGCGHRWIGDLRISVFVATWALVHLIVYVVYWAPVS